MRHGSFISKTSYLPAKITLLASNGWEGQYNSRIFRSGSNESTPAVACVTVTAGAMSTHMWSLIEGEDNLSFGKITKLGGKYMFFYSI